VAEKFVASSPGSAARPDAPARLTFAVNVRRARQRTGITQRQLAELSGLQRTFIGSVERAERNISVDNMDRIAGALRTTVASLLEPETDLPDAAAGAPRAAGDEARELKL
jgi:transcriptional regulator with XRE-family HTH domain